jgi:uncharacterized protein YukJ
MPLPNYGLLTGRVIEHGRAATGNPHYLMSVQAGGIKYQVSLNIETTRPGRGPSPATLQFQIIDDLHTSKLKNAKALAGSLVNNNRFDLASENPALSRLDYVRGGVISMGGFKALAGAKRGGQSSNNFLSRLVEALTQAVKHKTTYVAVFGSGYTAAPGGTLTYSDPARSSMGFTGVENVHMNQGSLHQIGQHLTGHFDENGPHQDGALLIVTQDAVQGFFAKFTSQDNETDPNGNPVHTGVVALDQRVRKYKVGLPANPYAYLAPIVTRTRKKVALARASVPPPVVAPSPSASLPVPTPTQASPGDYVFDDLGTGGNDPIRPFKPDDDSAVRNSPYVANFAKYGVPEPVPAPRGGAYPVMSLEEVLGTATVKAIRDSGQLIFHSVGDTGAPAQSKLPNEMDVANLMLEDFAGAAKADRPAFFYHLGDVVYYYGEQEYYYDQFYEPYKKYPAPIFAIPGNHDGITYSAQMVSLAPFINAFCDAHPSSWQGSGGVARTTMNQPGVYFQLDAPFVSIIGLYSNCDESFGYLDQQQKLFLHDALVALKPKRASGQISAVLVAVHHPPLSFSTKKPSSANMRDDMDAACTAAGIWPDAVFSGHAHVYQRMTRSVGTGSATRQIPYIICGAGGYNKDPRQEVDKADFKLQGTSDPQFRLHQFFPNYGYMKLIVKKGTGKNHDTLRMEFRSPDKTLGSPADACTLDLNDHVLL